MSREEHLIASARTSTGDATIFDVGIAHPRGAPAGSGGIGSVLAGDVGSIVGDGSAGGSLAADQAAATARGLPHRMCLALTPTHLHVLGMGATGYDTEPIAKIELATATVRVTGQVMHRLVSVADDAARTTYAFEVPRINPYHALDLVDRLAGETEASVAGRVAETA
jgi:hypothetical protein